MKIIFTLILLVANSCFAEEIDSSKLTPTVRKFVKENSDLNQYQASCHSLQRCKSLKIKNKNFTNKDYKRHEKTYQLKVSKSDFFEHLTNEPPKNIWHGDSKFQLLYRKKSNQFFYNDDLGVRLEKDDIIMLELTVGVGIVKMKIPVAF